MILEHQHFDLSEKVILERIVFHPPLRIVGNMHNEACFLYAVNGSSQLYATEGVYDIKKHKSVVMKCGNYLNNWSENLDKTPSEAIAAHFYPDVLKDVYQDSLPEFLIQKKTNNLTSVKKVKVDEMINKYIESLLFYFENPSLINDELICLKIKELILLLVNTDSSNNIISILQDLFNPIEHDFKKVIQAHLFEDLSIEELSNLTSLSVSSFKRKFKQVFNDSPAHYIKTKRLEKAAELLVVSSIRISNICYDCGFKDVAHFSKSFTAKYNCSPSEYRDREMS